MKIQIKKLLPILTLLAFTPFSASAQSTTGGLGSVVARISDLLGAIVPVLIGLGVVYLIWGVIQYFIAADEEAKTTGRDKIIFGIIGLAIIVSIWGLVAILNQTLGISGNNGLVGVDAPTSINKLVVSSTDSSSCDGKLEGKVKLQNLMNYVTCIIGNSVIPLIFALAVVMFIWGAVQFFIINGGEEEKRTQGKQFMLWGLIALAVMISIWSIVNIIGETFGIDTTFLPEVKSQK